MDPETQSLVQKKIAFAQSEHVGATLAILKDSFRKGPLVGETEYNTLVNAITMDAQSDIFIKFIETVDFIKKGGLLNSNNG